MSKYSPKRKTPCKECPFRRDSTRGWLGSDNPDSFLDLTLRDADMPCHMDIDYSDKQWATTQEPTAQMCAGAQIFQKNYMKMPRDPDVLETWNNVKESVHVFATPEEFLIHHHSGMHDYPADPSMRWKASEVNAALGFVDFVSITHIVPDDPDDERSLFIATAEDGRPVRSVADPEGRGYATAVWVKEWFHGHGVIERITAPKEIFEAVLAKAIEVGPFGDQSSMYPEDDEE